MIMTFTQEELLSFSDQWSVIERQCQSSHRQWVSSGGVAIDETPPDDYFNLPLVLAFSLLDEVLGSLANQGVFALPRPNCMLGTKMTCSRSAISWRDYAALSSGKDARNALAHEGKMLPRAQCLTTIKAIGVELTSWGALASG